MNSQHMFDLLYESVIIPSGQLLLKTLPLEIFVKKYENYVDLDGTEISNPLIFASHYSDIKILEKAKKLGFGAVTSKTITRYKEKGNSKVTVIRRGSTLVNCEGLRNPGMDDFRIDLESREKIEGLIISVAGDAPEEYGVLVKTLSPYADLTELNISCPNKDSIYDISKNPERLDKIFYHSRNATNKPIIVKLSPDFEDDNYRFVIPLAIKNGINIINYGNTRRVKESRLSHGFGGLSGPDLFDSVKTNVQRIRKEFGDDMYIIATGGIDNPEKAHLLLTYADAVSLLAAFVKPIKGLFLAEKINPLA